MNAPREHATDRAAEWVYRGVWGALTGWLRVPDAPPRLPAGSGGAVRAFRPSHNWLRMRKFEFWLVALIVDVSLLAAWLILFANEPTLAMWLLVPWLALMIVPDIIVYVMLHLRYDTTWYVMSERSVRIRRGVLVIHEKTLTFDNVQNVEVRQGPLQRYFGVANVTIQTAGGGAAASAHPATAGALGSHHGLIEGVDNAQEIREQIMLRVRAVQGAGLGDEAPERPARYAGAGLTPAHRAALREVRELARSIARPGA